MRGVAYSRNSERSIVVHLWKMTLTPPPLSGIRSSFAELYADAKGQRMVYEGCYFWCKLFFLIAHTHNVVASQCAYVRSRGAKFNHANINIQT